MYRRSFNDHVILENLLELSIAYINKIFELRRIGKCTKVLNIETTNIISNKVEATYSIAITVNIESSNDYLIFEYVYNNKYIKDRIPLVEVKSNLGKGSYYYFECKYTGRLFRKLYLYEGYFVGRNAVPNIYYNAQLQSKKYRTENSYYKKIFKCSEIIKDSRKKHFRYQYKGSATIKNKRLIEACKYIDLVYSLL